MSNKRNQNGEKSRIKAAPDEETKRGGRNDRKATPVKSHLGGSSNSSRLRRGLRPRKEAQSLCASPAATAATGSSAGAQELCSYKTPKRLSKRNLWLAAFSSPSSDAEIQEEIFWDPQSPTLYTPGNEKRKGAGSKCTVEISEIVNRIPPQKEDHWFSKMPTHIPIHPHLFHSSYGPVTVKKQANSEVAHLKMWIGEDAIPCTPGVVKVRGRTKLIDTKLKLKNSEEELLQLVKEFNKNLVDAVQQQDTEDHTSISDTQTLSNNVHEDTKIRELHSFLEDVPEAVIALSLKPVKDNTGLPHLEPIEKSSQKSIDQEAEASYNAIFDCSTQKLSGQLSQSLLDTSNNNLLENKYVQRENSHISKQIKTEEQCVSIDMCCKQNSLLPFPSMIQIATPKIENTLIIPKENIISMVEIMDSSIQTTVPTKKDEVNEWGNKDEDLLKDDSFIMQITQNPELISTSADDLRPIKPSKSLLASNENSKAKAKANESSSWVADKALLTQSNHLQYVTRKANKGINNVSESFSESVDGREKPKIKGSPLQNESTFKAVKICYEESTPNRFSSTASQISVKPEIRGAKTGNLLKCSSSISVSGKESSSISEHYNSNSSQSGNCKINTHTVFQKSSSSSSTNNISVGSRILAAQTSTGKQNPLETITQCPATLDDWNDPKFSDEILDMFCELDNLWEANEKEDDDLLYQVCDDIEKMTQSQDVMQGNKTIHELMQPIPASCKPLQSASSSGSKPGLSCETLQSKHASYSISSLDTSFCKSSSWINNKTVAENAIKCGKSAVRPAHPLAIIEHTPAISKSVNSQNFNISVLKNKVNKDPVKLNRSHSTYVGGFASEHCSLSYSHGVNVSQNKARTLSISSANKAPVEPSTFKFTKCKSSQLTNVHTDDSGTVSGCTFQTKHNMDFGEGKNQSTIPLYQTVQIGQHSSLKRHLSEPSIQSTKEQRSQKCSQEEIERKKQEALARRKMRMQKLLKVTSPT